MKRLISYAIASALLFVAPALALADDGYVTGNVTMYSGPDSSYPPVETIPAGEPVSIEGCTDGYGWCDVIWGEDRGWVAGNYIQYEYDNQPVLLGAYGAAIGIPIVSFVIGDYWGRYYHNRPFWGQRERWFNRPVVHHAPPRAFGGPLHDYAHAPARQAVHVQGRPAVGYPAHRGTVPGAHPEYRNTSGNHPAQNHAPVNRAPAHQQNRPAPKREEHKDDRGH